LFATPQRRMRFPESCKKSIFGRLNSNKNEPFNDQCGMNG
jgi:hypothetical protein